MGQNNHQLKEGSLGIGESIIMGVAGTAPAYSLAATTSVLVVLVGIQAMASVLYCGLIMFGISLAFLHLNRYNTSAGGSYTWISDVFHPTLGFFAGWSLLVASTVFMVSGTIPAAIATLALFSPAHIEEPHIVTLVAAGWLLLVGGIVIKGIKLTSYFQIILTVIEVVLLAVVIIGGLLTFYSDPVQSFHWKQLSLGEFTPQNFATGALTALFFYWGWDVTVNLSEETKNAADNPGRGALTAMFIVLILFVSFMLAVQLAFTNVEIDHAGTNIVFELAERVFPAPWSYMAIIAVMLSTIGTLETTMLQFTRTMFAKGRTGSMNSRYARLHKKWQTPWLATTVIVMIGLVLLFGASFLTTIDDIIVVSVEAIGFQIAFYYGLSAFACAWRFRKTAFKNVKDLILLLLWPLIGALFMLFIFVYCAMTFDLSITLLGVGGIIAGVIPLILNRKKHVKIS